MAAGSAALLALDPEHVELAGEVARGEGTVASPDAGDIVNEHGEGHSFMRPAPKSVEIFRSFRQADFKVFREITNYVQCFFGVPGRFGVAERF
jgi:hypothetical protein